MTMFSDGMLLGAGGAAPLAFVTATSATAASANSIVVPLTGMSTGQLVLVFLQGANTSAAASAAGWSQVMTSFTAATRFTVLSKVLDGSEGASVTVSVPSATSATNAIAVAYSGGSGAVDVSGSGSQGNSTLDSVAPSVTATKLGILITAHYIQTSSRTVTTPPAGMTQRKLETALNSHAVYELDPSAIGATAAKTLTWSGSTASTRGLTVQIY